MDDSTYVGKLRLVVTGDRLLIAPLSAGERTHTGLYLPDSAADGKKVSSGWVEAVGPGYPVASPVAPDEEPWKQPSRPQLQFIPLQARKGDFAMYVKSSAYELNLEGKTFFVVPYSAVLVLLREDWDAASIVPPPEPEA